MGFTLRERQILGIHGLLPPAFFTDDEQISRVLTTLRQCDTDLDKFMYLSSLQDYNEKLYGKVIQKHFDELALLMDNPTVGQACLKYGVGGLFCRPRGLFITIYDIGHVYDILCNWPELQVKVIVITNGENISCLGDLGAYAMGIPVGKLSLYRALAGIPSAQCLPIVLDIGTDNELLLQEPTYIGLRHKRVRGIQNDALTDEVMKSIVHRYGQNTFVTFEGFAHDDALRLLNKYRNRYLACSDEIQGTAAVAVAGIISAMRVTQTRLCDHKFLFLVAEEASIGIADLLVLAMLEEGSGRDEAISKIWIVDSAGLVTRNRMSDGITVQKAVYSKDHRDIQGLEEVCEVVKPTAAIGAGGIFTEKFIQMMGSLNRHPVIFALSSPVSMAECTAEQAYTLTEGRCIYASGSEFDPVEIDGKFLVPGQANNAYVFPGVVLASVISETHHVTDEMFLKAAQALADMVTDSHLAEGRVYPPLNAIRDILVNIATKIITYSYQKGLAAHYPEPQDKEGFVRMHLYSHD